VAQTRRLLLAKQLLHETSMRMVDVAFASGFRSLRRFNDTFRTLYGRPPSRLRRETAALASRGISLTLGYAPPYDWPAMLESLAREAIPGVERVTGDSYRRTIALHGVQGTLEVTPVAGKHALSARLELGDVRALPSAIARVRSLFDLGSDVAAIAAQLCEDPSLEPRVKERPGLRVPGAWDAFELSARSLLGSAAGAVVARLGESLPAERAGLTTLFPGPERLATAALDGLGLSAERAHALRALARAVTADPQLLARDVDLDATLARLRGLPGLDERAAQTVAMRALREPDAFPCADPALRARAERWRPWRAYAAQYLGEMA